VPAAVKAVLKNTVDVLTGQAYAPSQVRPAIACRVMLRWTGRPILVGTVHTVKPFSTSNLPDVLHCHLSAPIELPGDHAWCMQDELHLAEGIVTATNGSFLSLAPTLSPAGKVHVP